MSWAWVRPADMSVLSGRPLLDLGAGDGQTARALGLLDDAIVALDRSVETLRAARLPGARLAVAGDARDIPLRYEAFAVVLAADLFHHLDDPGARDAMAEIRRVLRPGGLLVAWGYAQPGRPAPDSPRFPRDAGALLELASSSGLDARELALVATIEPTPATAGISARKA